MVTGPAVGSSSVAWLTPSGVSTSTAFGTLPGSTAQIGLFPPGAQTPNEKSPGVGVNPRAWSGENPSCPVSTTVKAQPGRLPSSASCRLRFARGPFTAVSRNFPGQNFLLCGADVNGADPSGGRRGHRPFTAAGYPADKGSGAWTAVNLDDQRQLEQR